MHFLSNSRSDSSFEDYLRDTHRLTDYRNVINTLLPDLIDSFAEFSIIPNIRFNCCNRFDGRYPSIRIQTPVGFVPDFITVEFPNRHDKFIVRFVDQESTIQGIENLASHLRVILSMGIAHWQPN